MLSWMIPANLVPGLSGALGNNLKMFTESEFDRFYFLSFMRRIIISSLLTIIQFQAMETLSNMQRRG